MPLDTAIHLLLFIAIGVLAWGQWHLWGAIEELCEDEGNEMGELAEMRSGPHFDKTTKD